MQWLVGFGNAHAKQKHVNERIEDEHCYAKHVSEATTWH
jgi:hypothetical protein